MENQPVIVIYCFMHVTLQMYVNTIQAHSKLQSMCRVEMRRLKEIILQ